MTDDVKEFDGNGHEVLGQIRVLKVAHDEGADRPYHLELDLDDGLTDAWFIMDRKFLEILIFCLRA